MSIDWSKIKLEDESTWPILTPEEHIAMKAGNIAMAQLRANINRMFNMQLIPGNKRII